MILRKRSPNVARGTQLGFALQLCLLRYPGFGLRIDEPVPRICWTISPTN